MQPRIIVLPALLIGSLSLPVLSSAAPGDAAAKPAPAAPAPAAPPAPATKPTPPPAPAKPEEKLPKPKPPLEAALEHVVMLERAGRPIGVGTLLSGDGRILTALSPLTHGNQIEARYANGRVLKVKLSHSDRAWDLALLTPEGDNRASGLLGLKASRDAAPVAGSKVFALGHVQDKKLGSSPITIKAKSTLRGADSAQLEGALELPYAPKPTDLGAPLVNDKGEVVAITARACSVTDKLGCTLAPYGAPVSAVRSFLRGVPAQRRPPAVGMEVVAFDAGVARGVRVAALAPSGPAASAGVREGDVVLGVDGSPVASSEAFADALEAHPAGSPLRLTLLREGRYLEASIYTPELASAGSGAGQSAPSPGTSPARSERVFRSNPSGSVPPPAAAGNPSPPFTPHVIVPVDRR